MWTWIKNLFNKALKFFKAFLKEVFNNSTQIILAALTDIAVASVNKLASTDMSSEDKRKAAFKEIKDYAIAQGIEARDSLINLLIEMAVNAAKNAAKE